MFHYYLSSPLGVTTDLAGTHGPTGVSANTGNPKDRAVLTLEWERGPWDVTGTVNYTGAFNLTDPSIGLNTCGESIVESGKWSPPTGYTGPASFCNVDRFVDVDLYTKYSFNKHFTVHGTVLNLFDKPPPLDMQTYGGGGGASFDGAFHDAGAGASTVSVRPTLSNCAANFSPAHHGSVSELRSRNRTEHFSSLIRERRICPESVTETMYGPLQQWIRLLRAVRGDSQLCE